MNIIVRHDPKGLERGSGGTPKTVGIHGGGLAIDLWRDKNYADARKRWEEQLPPDIRESAIQRERATTHYYTCLMAEVDPTDPDGSRERFEQYVQDLQRKGWEVTEARIENHPMFTKRNSMAMWAELKRQKTYRELML